MNARFIPFILAGVLVLIPPALEAQDPLARADSAWARGNHDQAFRLYSDLRGEGRIPLLGLHRMALVHVWNERYPEGLALLDEALERDPGYLQGRRERGLLRGRMGDFDAALADLDAYLLEDPDDAEVLEVSARYQSWTGRHEAAIRNYERLLEMDPDRTDLRLARARVLSWDGRLDEAVEGYREVLEAEPRNPEVLVGLAQVLSWTGRFDEARSEYLRVLEADPESPGARRGLAQVATWRGDLREGELLWREALAVSPEDGDNLMGLASNLRMQGREREAGDYLARVRDRDPENDALIEEQARLDQALRPRLSPTYSYTWDSDRNRIHAVSLNARWKPSDPVELSATAGWRSLAQTNRPELDQRVTTLDMGILARRPGGWGARAGIGAWRPGASDQDVAMTALVGLSMPPWWRARADLTLTRSVFDATALVADSRVTLTELALSGSVRTGPSGNLYGHTSTARFRGSETNTRNMATARYVHRVRPWLQTGPGIRTFTFARTVDDGYWNPRSYFVAEFPATLTSSRGDLNGRLEVAPGYQRSAGEADPWSPSFRVEAGVTRDFQRGRQVGISGIYADSGAQRLSGAGDGGYRFRGVTLFGVWPL
jgi:tetratricopeptide (TPR) repeat protein